MAPRVMDLSFEEKRVVQRRKLLALAGALDDIGLRARIAEYSPRPAVLRCWDPREQGVTRQVTCDRAGETWEFRFHPSGERLAGADGVDQPEDARDAARELGDSFRSPQSG